MTISLPARTDLTRSQRRSSVARALALMVAVVVLLVSLSAEAKKKKKGAKGKTPSSSTKKKSGGAAPAEESGSDEEEEKSSSKSAPADEGEEKEASKPSPPPSEEEAAPVKKAPPKAAAKAPAEGEETPGGLSALRVGVGGKALFRSLSWTDDMGALAPYTLSPGPEISGWLEAYPAAFATDGFAANIGVYGLFNYGIGAQSKLPNNGGTLTTKYQDFLGGLKIRIPLGMFVPYVAGAYGMQKFELTPPDNTRPNFNYAFIRAGAGARIMLTPEFDLDVGGGYLIVTNTGSGAGQLKALYPNATANGVDVNLSLGYRITSLIGIRVGGDFRQYGVALHWRTGNPGVVAGGATDRYITAWGGIEIILDGVGGGGGEEAAPAKKAPAKAKKAPSPDEEPAADSDKEKASDVE